MAKPVIHLVVPIHNRIDGILTVLIMGRHFDRSADAQTLGDACEMGCTWRSDKLIELELLTSQYAAGVGIVVLNDVNSFTPDNTSDIYICQ